MCYSYQCAQTLWLPFRSSALLTHADFIKLQGGLSRVVRALRKECIDLLVEMEARLDFEDEMPDLDNGVLIERVASMEHTVQEALATANKGHLLQSGLQVSSAYSLLPK